MNCKKCGCPLDKQWQYCTKCNTPANSKVVEQITAGGYPLDGKESEWSLGKKDVGKIYVIIFLISVALSFMIPRLGPAILMVLLIIIVSGKIKHPDNKAIKFLFGLYLFFKVLLIIASIIFLAMCVYMTKSCGY